MTDTIQWHESDREFISRTSEPVSLTDAMIDCVCGRPLQWVLEPDPDSLRYTASCDDCGRVYDIKPETFVVNELDRRETV